MFLPHPEGLLPEPVLELQGRAGELLLQDGLPADLLSSTPVGAHPMAALHYG